MRRIALLPALILVVLALAGMQEAASNAGGATAVVSASTFVFAGHGYGHGLGMSQWGARGYAAAGLPYDQILAHYYPGTELGGAGPVPAVRVLFFAAAKTVTIRSDAPFAAVDAAGDVHQLPAGPVAVGPDLTLPVDGGAAQPLPGPVTFRPGTSPLGIKHLYRGSIQVSVANGRLRVINVVGLEDYLLGVVPAEMPSSWPAAALQAQAVAARTYALASRKPKGDFDVYQGVTSQAYGGIEVESPATTAAVTSTAGRIVLYDGRPAFTMFSSSSGGETASAAEEYPSSATPAPYLVAVDDPYDAASPYHDWGPLAIPGSTVAKALKVPGSLLDLQVQDGPSGRVSTVTAVGTRGQVTATGGTVRSALGLRSTWFQVGVLSLARPAEPALPGAQVMLGGLVRGVADPVALQARGAGGAWAPVAAVTPGQDGSFSVAVAPSLTTTYRLAAGALAGPSVRVAVAPAVTLAETTGVLTGTARPAPAGAVVELQRLQGTAWTTVATATLDAEGAFDVPVPPEPGSYRARVALGGGLAPGISPVVQA